MQRIEFWFWFLDALVHGYIWATGGYLSWASFFLTIGALLLHLIKESKEDKQKKETYKKMEQIVNYFESIKYF